MKIVNEFKNDFSYTTGSHVIKLGGAYSYLPSDDDVPDLPFGTWTFTTDQYFDGTAVKTVATV